MKRRAVAVDLDGTLLATNTFVEYVLFSFRESLKNFRADLAAGIIGLVLLRRFRAISHSTMKRRLLCLLDTFMNEKRISRFVTGLLGHAAEDVVALCERYHGQGCYLLLATAAPRCYAAEVASRMGLDGCCATASPVANDNWRENVGEHKRDTVLRYLDEMNLSLSAVITDHHDDIPLMAANPGENILVNPSMKTVTFVKGNGILVEIL